MKIKHLFFIIFLISCTAFAQQKKPFTIETLYKVIGVGGPVLSPDDKTIAFTASELNLKEGKSASEIYLMNIDGSGLTKITDDEHGKSSLAWAGNDLLYISGGQLHRMNISSKSSDKITDYHAGISEPVLSSDGRNLFFIAGIFPECGADNDCNKKISTSADEGPIQAYIADELMFRHWTEYAGGKVPNLILYDIQSKEYRSLASSPWLGSTYMLAGGKKFDVSPDGSEVCFVKNPDKDLASSTNADLFIVSTKGGEEVNITADNKALDAHPVYSPDGRYIAYVLQSVPNFEADMYRLAVYDRTTKKSSVLTGDFDYQVDDFIWGSNSQDIFFTAAVEGYSPVYRVNVNKPIVEQVIAKRSIFGFDVTSDNKIVFNSRSVDKPAEIYIYQTGSNEPKQLTAFNKELLEEYDIRPAEQFWVDGADGKKMHVFMVKPHNFDESKKYPVILNVHGGPQSQWMDAFRGDWQVYPGSGYIVIFPNPHGSLGYGQEYTNAISGDWGGKVYEDLMLLMDEVEKMPFVDTERIGAMGWSYGGYMMNWFQAKTKRFKCFVSMMGIFDLESMWGATEELWFVNWDLKGQPWSSDIYKKYSPSNYVENFSTPALIITGKLDYRVPYSQSLQYFTTLQVLGIDSRLIIFPNDGHWPSHLRSMPLYYNAHLEWFHKYLGGAPAPYDSKKMITNTAFDL
jgi:dipeptidyl aminopeptidase/acylaminoacyl peptidase